MSGTNQTPSPDLAGDNAGLAGEFEAHIADYIALEEGSSESLALFALENADRILAALRPTQADNVLRDKAVALALAAGKLNVALDGQERFRSHRQAVVRAMDELTAALKAPTTEPNPVSHARSVPMLSTVTMTDDKLAVSQEAREAAARIVAVSELRPIILAGKFDEHPYVQAFARFEAQARLAGERADKWQDIASAPKDGTAILVYFGSELGVQRVTWDSPHYNDVTPENGIWCVDDNKHGPYSLRGYCEGDDTHWQPLPAAPTPEQSQ